MESRCVGALFAVLMCVIVCPRLCFAMQPSLMVPEGPVAPPGSSLDEIHRPLHVVNKLYKEALRKGESVTGDFGVRAHFLAALKDRWHLVPSLNTVERLDQLEPGCLVRFRCMVQGHFNPEYYLGQVFTSDNEALTTKYRDSVPPAVEALPDVNDLKVARAMWERTPIKCIEIPGETEWAKLEYAVLTPQLRTPRQSDAAEGVLPSPRKRQLHNGEEWSGYKAGETMQAAQAEDGTRKSPTPTSRATPRRFVKSVHASSGASPSADNTLAPADGDRAEKRTQPAAARREDEEEQEEEHKEEAQEEEGGKVEADSAQVLEARARAEPMVKDKVLMLPNGSQIVFESHEEAVEALTTCVLNQQLDDVGEKRGIDQQDGEVVEGWSQQETVSGGGKEEGGGGDGTAKILRREGAGGRGKMRGKDTEALPKFAMGVEEIGSGEGVEDGIGVWNSRGGGRRVLAKVYDEERSESLMMDVTGEGARGVGVGGWEEVWVWMWVGERGWGWGGGGRRGGRRCF
jgi:hypothetical protein